MTARDTRKLAVVVTLLLTLPSSSAVSQDSDFYINYRTGYRIQDNGVLLIVDNLISGQVEGGEKFRVLLSFSLFGAPQASKARLLLEIKSFYSPDEFETLDVFDGPRGHNWPVGVALYDYIGSGTEYGTARVSRYTDFVSIELPTIAVEEINNLPRYFFDPYVTSSWFRVGLTLREPFAPPGELEAIQFGTTSVRGINQLVITPVNVPVEPMTWGRIKALYKSGE